jgi:hypothetical protein
MSTLTTHKFTPNPVGFVPAEIGRFDQDPNRLDLEIGDEDYATFEAHRYEDVYRFIFTDVRSGDRFLYLGRADCGAGCRCAVEAVWIGKD